MILRKDRYTRPRPSFKALMVGYVTGVMDNL